MIFLQQNINLGFCHKQITKKEWHLLLHRVIPEEKETMSVQYHVRLLFRLMKYIENTNVDIYPNSFQEPTNEWSRFQVQIA